MMRISMVVAILVLASAACSSKSKQVSQDTAQAADGREQSPPPSGSASMPAGFSKAYTSFREHIAQTLDVGLDEVQLGPSYEEAGDQFEYTVGRAWGFRGFRKDAPLQSVQGWATADGTVVTHEQNLGILFEQAGVWTDAPEITATELAKRLVWSLGMEYRLFVEPSSGAPVPSLQLGADGAGTLVFFLSYKQPGPGGAGGGPEQHYKATVTLTPAHKATLELTELSN